MKPRPAFAGPRMLRASGDRWLFGYADVVTLLFACFAALYAAQVPQITEAAAAAPAPEVAPATLVTPEPLPAAEPQLTPEPLPTSEPEAAPAAPALPPWADEIAALAAAEDQIHVNMTAGIDGTVISLAETGSFAAGRADLTPAAQRLIAQLAAVLRDRGVAIQVEGHTDNVAIHASKYESNWELSTARASRVVEFLVREADWPPDRLSAAGYGEFRPKGPNDTPKARARNRRVDLVVRQANPVQDEVPQADYRDVGVRPSDRR